MTKTEVTYLLGKILGLSYNGLKEEVAKELAHENMDWILFVKRANRYLILPTLYYELREAGLLHLLPEELSDHLKEIFTLSKQRNDAIESQLGDVCRLLNAKDIVPTILKGGGNMIEKLYPDKGVRIMTDVDMLVSDDNFLKSAQVLMDDGYLSQYVFDEIYTSIDQAKDYPRLYRGDVPVDIEIHRLPVANEFARYFGFAESTQNQKLISGDYKANVLSYENNAILNFIHGQLTDKAALYKNINLKNMYDLWLLSQRVDVEQVFEKFGHYRKQAFAYYGAVLKLFSGEINAGLRVQQEGEKYLRHVMFYTEHSKKYYRQKKWKYLAWRISYSYIKFPLSTIFNKANRKLLFKKLSGGKWYHDHLKSFKNNM